MKIKGEQIGRKVREIKFPQYIINEAFEVLEERIDRLEKFEKMKMNFMFLF